MRYLILFSLLFALCQAGAAAPGIRLEGVKPPFTTGTYSFTSQGQELEMVYMDVKPEGVPLGTVVLLHGKNFSGSYFAQTAKELVKAGYRVVMPDQIGFGRSSKPGHYQFSFQQLAQNTHGLLESIGVDSANMLGHSMGGMLAVRYALMYPQQTQSLTLLNPIGLEDWKAKGVPYRSIDEWYQSELNKTPDKIRAYQLDSYYDGQWKTAYDPWVEELAEFIKSPGYATMAWDQALTYDMIFTQPVIYELEELEVPVLLIIGQRDTTALGKDRASPELRKQLGNYPRLGREAAEAIPESVLVELDGVGHLPHIEAFDRFMPPYLAFLKAAVGKTSADRFKLYQSSSEKLMDQFIFLQSMGGM
ncbi:alpha/beta hydrolase [Ruficoccus amylovorans]|uniref:Alpha/beta hydrolase n=1 Tax=Ruficoccus amylovorans TaxID=1804625 RepID=A0A842HBX1_9BACT|nr:alpha/beta hydrolase [Ruficoccus amylovorans]MBC2593955.1 alpha/beta hydrolase [Ruficoccus amylovorans]